MEGHLNLRVQSLLLKILVAGVEARFAKAAQFETQADECPLAFQKIAGRCYFFGYFKVKPGL